MRYDFKLIEELCRELGLQTHVRSGDSLAIELGPSVFLRFQNGSKDSDCLVRFEDTSWHDHGVLMFADRDHRIQINYLEVIDGLKDGKILLCELWTGGNLKDRRLIHCEFNDEFKYMQAGEEIRIRRIG